MKAKMKFTMLALAATFLLSTDLQAQDGSLDLSFGTNGIVTTDIGSDHDGAAAMTLLSNGKILVAGYAFINGNYDFALARYNSDGSLDLTFDTDGIVTTDIGGGEDVVRAISLQPDGKILLAGYSHNGSNNDFALVRYNSDGSLDLTFDTDGKLTTAIGTGTDVANAMSLQPDGKILLGGFSRSFDENFALVRYNSDGSLDLTFDTDGIVTTNIGDADIGRAITLQLDGKILLAGFSIMAVTSYDFSLVRYNSDGSLDLTFDSDGIVTTDIEGTNNADVATAISLKSDGKILLAGDAFIGIDRDFALAQYNSDGSLDLSFDSDGIVTTNVGSSLEYATTISLQLDGKILLGGQYDNGTNDDFALVRYNSNGSLDLTFDTDGIVITAIGGSSDIAYAMSLQPDGKILIAGHSDNGTNYDFALARYNNTITAINTIEDSNPNLLIYPNPFSSTTTIQFGSTIVDAELSIYNMFGQKVKTISNISDATISLNRNELSSGFYVVSLTQNKKVVATSKIVVVD